MKRAIAAEPPKSDPVNPVIDIHQHQGYQGRTDEQLVTHQRKMGVTTTVLLPSARAFDRLEDGSRNDPVRAKAAGNEAAVRLTRRLPGEFVFFANELPTLDSGFETIETHLKMGACGIGESKFPVRCDSKHIHRLAELAQAYEVPLLLHFQHKSYNLGFERFHKTLEKFPRVNFIGHAQTWWGNIDLRHDQKLMYPKTRVTPGGMTDRYLSDYPNMFGDYSAGSGNNSLRRDEDHAREFLERHQDKLLFGSDCPDQVGSDTYPAKCTGRRTRGDIERLAPTRQIARKILYENAKKLLKL
ncbi:MAG: amidohydrolase family protein [Planctomycetota bacterium]